MVKMILILATLFQTADCLSQIEGQDAPSAMEGVSPPEPPPKLEEWYDQWKQANPLFVSNMNIKLLIIKSTSMKMAPVSTSHLSGNDSLYLYTLSDAEIDLTMGINQMKSGNPCLLGRPQIFRCFSAGYILDVSRPTWELLTFASSDDKLSRMMKSPKEPNDDYFKWVSANLGFDGRVLDYKNGHILALTPKLPTSTRITARLLKDSASKAFLKKSQVKLGTKLILTETKGRLSVFKIMDDTNAEQVDAPISTKIVLDPFTRPASEDSKNIDEATPGEANEP